MRSKKYYSEYFSVDKKADKYFLLSLITLCIIGFILGIIL